MPLLLWAFARIICFIVLIIALLCVKKTRLRHLPSRRTRVSRHHGETCVWLERLTSAILEMLHSAIQEEQQQQQQQQQEGDDVDVEDIQQCLRGYTFSSVDSVGTTPLRGSRMSGSSTNNSIGNTNTNNITNSSTTRNRSKSVASNSMANNSSSFSCEDDGISSMEIPSRLLKVFEERVEAILEDRGIAASAKCKVHSIGQKPPTIRSIRITNLTGTGFTTTIPTSATAGVSAAVGSNNNSINSNNVGLGLAGSVPVGSSAPGGNIGVVGVNNNNTNININNNNTNNNNTSASHKGKSRHLQSNLYTTTGIGSNIINNNNNNISSNSSIAGNNTNNTHTTNANSNNNNNNGVGIPTATALDDVMDMWRSDSFMDESIVGVVSSAAAAAAPTPPSIASAVELEAEVEYAGGVDVSLDADLCLARGRRLPVSIRVSDIKYIKAHVRVCATLQYERATMDSQRRPYLQCTLWLESEPTFSLKLTTFISRYRICNFFAVPLVIKFLLLRFLRHRLLRPAGVGVSVNIPLPENIVDGGVQSWGAAVNDAATTVAGSMSGTTHGIPRGR